MTYFCDAGVISLRKARTEILESTPPACGLTTLCQIHNKFVCIRKHISSRGENYGCLIASEVSTVIDLGAGASFQCLGTVPYQAK